MLNLSLVTNVGNNHKDFEKNCALRDEYNPFKKSGGSGSIADDPSWTKVVEKSFSSISDSETSWADLFSYVDVKFDDGVQKHLAKGIAIKDDVIVFCNKVILKKQSVYASFIEVGFPIYITPYSTWGNRVNFPKNSMHIYPTYYRYDKDLVVDDWQKKYVPETVKNGEKADSILLPNTLSLTEGLSYYHISEVKREGLAKMLNLPNSYQKYIVGLEIDVEYIPHFKPDFPGTGRPGHRPMTGEDQIS